MITPRTAEIDPIGSRVRPTDECSWPRPFPEGFDGCPAYVQQRFIPLDIKDQPLTPVRTCRHLLSRRLPGRTGGWYAGCQIGDAAARQRWGAATDGGRLRALGTLRTRMEAISQPFVERIWAAKAQQRAAEHGGASAEPADDELGRAAAEFLSECAAFLTRHRQEFEQAELRPDMILLVIRRSLEHFVEQDGREASWDVPTYILSELPERDRFFFRMHASS